MALGEELPNSLSVGEPRRFGASGGLGKFFFHRRAGKARLDSAQRINVRRCRDVIVSWIKLH
jgi:hypothetical protein